jgi:transcriptional regulator with XRE-family HTH domain
MRGPRTNDLTVSRAVGANVAALRKARGLSQRALARETQQSGKPVGFSTITRMEKAATPGASPVAIFVDDVVSLAAALGVTVQQLISAPKCNACMDSPPPGFACRTCGATA